MNSFAVGEGTNPSSSNIPCNGRLKIRQKARGGLGRESRGLGI